MLSNLHRSWNSAHTPTYKSTATMDIHCLRSFGLVGDRLSEGTKDISDQPTTITKVNAKIGAHGRESIIFYFYFILFIFFAPWIFGRQCKLFQLLFWD